MEQSVYKNIIIRKSYKIDNGNKDIIALSVKNLGNTSVFFDGLEILPGTQQPLIYPTNTVKTNQDIKLIFNDDNDAGNKVYVSMDRYVPQPQCR